MEKVSGTRRYASYTLVFYFYCPLLIEIVQTCTINALYINRDRFSNLYVAYPRLGFEYFSNGLAQKRSPSRTRQALSNGHLGFRKRPSRLAKKMQKTTKNVKKSIKRVRIHPEVLSKLNSASSI